MLNIFKFYRFKTMRRENILSNYKNTNCINTFAFFKIFNCMQLSTQLSLYTVRYNNNCEINEEKNTHSILFKKIKISIKSVPDFCARIARLNFVRLSVLLNYVYLQFKSSAILVKRFLLLISSICEINVVRGNENFAVLKDAINYFILAYILTARFLFTQVQCKIQFKR